ncbi:MAG: hypothetical protein RBQ64_02225 [Candidatus Izemoplasmatales bacterium]|jgi:hypothetical protein|nr:hypothetical protein [Candidatus Izemoplasmatales bacterium]
MKIINLIILFFLSLLLFGCNGFSTTSELPTTDNITTEEPLQDLSLINNILFNFTLENSSGYDYHKIQSFNQIITNSDLIELRIEWQESPKAYTEKTSTRLQSFNIDSSSITTTDITFYNQNQKGSYNASSSLIWENYDINDYIDFDFGFQELKSEDIENLLSEDYLGIKTYNIQIKESSAATFFNNHTDSLTNLFITIVLDIANEKLISIKIEYHQIHTETFIEFVPFYDQTQVIIPE